MAHIEYYKLRFFEIDKISPEEWTILQSFRDWTAKLNRLFSLDNASSIIMGEWKISTWPGFSFSNATTRSFSRSFLYRAICLQGREVANKSIVQPPKFQPLKKYPPLSRETTDLCPLREREGLKIELGNPWV